MPRSSTPRIVVGDNSSYRIWLGVLLVFLVSLAVGLFALEYLEARANYRYQQSVREHDALKERIVELQELNTHLRERIATLEREKKIDREAQKQLSKTYKERLVELAGLRKKIVFYDSVVSPQDSRSGLRLHSFDVEPLGENTYHFELIISQVSKDYRLAKGVVDFSLEGVINGASKRLPLSKISKIAKSDLKYEFKYFQEFRGVLKLPSHFMARDLIVKLTPEGRKKGEKFRQSWPLDKQE